MAEPETSKDQQGPYLDENGECLGGHPLSSYGRCEPMNTGQCSGEDPCPFGQP